MSSRFLDEAECVVSVLLSIVAAHAVGAANVAWAAFAGLLVMRGHATDTLKRGALRLTGTVIGCCLAWLTAPLLIGRPVHLAVALFLAGTITVYMTLTADRAYAWLISGLTFIMVLIDHVAHPAMEVGAFIRMRLIENGTGTAVCVLVSLVSTFTLRRWWPAERVPVPQPIGWHALAFRHALLGGAALALLIAVASLATIPALLEAAITVVAVMLVPAADLHRTSLSPVTFRLLHRFVGCIAGGLLAACVVLLARGSETLLMGGIALGVAIGRHWENGGRAHRYAGTQFTFAVLITLVPDNFAQVGVASGLNRLTGALVGMAMIEPVLIAALLARLLVTWVRRPDGKIATHPAEVARAAEDMPPTQSSAAFTRAADKEHGSRDVRLGRCPGLVGGR